MLLASSIFGTAITFLVLFTFKEKAGASLFGKSTGRASMHNKMNSDIKSELSELSLG